MNDSSSLRKTLYAIAPVGLLLIAGATVVPLFFGPQYDGIWHKASYASGAIILLICRLFSPYRGDDMRLRRLHRIESWSAIFFCVACFFMFWPDAAMRDWLAFTLAGAAIQIYTSIAIPSRERKLVEERK